MDRVRRAAENMITVLTNSSLTPEIRHSLHDLQLALSATQNAAALLTSRPPAISTINEALHALNTSHEKGNFILISPDGRVWECKDINKMLGIIISLIDVGSLRSNTHAWRF